MISASVPIGEFLEICRERHAAEQATGCRGAGDYRLWAKQEGYEHCEVVDWTSSAGDWTFLVSRDGYEWFFMSQSNNYPNAGFSRQVNEDQPFYGNAKEAMEEACAYLNQ